MTVNLSDALRAWQDADDRAREAERRLAAAWDAYLSAGSPLPGGLQLEATAARREAMEKLDAVVAANRAAADEVLR